MRYPCLYLVIYMLTTSETRQNVSEENPQVDETARLEWLHVEPWLIPPPEIPEPPSPFVPSPPVAPPPQPPGTPYPPPQPSRTPPSQPPSSPQLLTHQSITHVAPLAEDIRCRDSQGQHSLSAIVTLPNGFSARPVFNDAPSVNPLESPYCSMKQSTLNTKSYYLQVTDFKRCGVLVHSGNAGKSWLSLTIRFPYVEGFRLVEDEYAMLVCRPQDRRAFREHVLELQGKLPHLSKTIFRNAPQDFKCKMALFAKSLPHGRFQRSVSSGSSIFVGEEVQLRAIVRPGDGWKYAAMTDIIVHRRMKSSLEQTSSKSFKPLKHGSRYVPDQLIRGENSNSINESKSKRPLGFSKDNDISMDVAHLVFDDGCRNPKFRTIAPRHPYTEPQSSLTVNFNFRTFMFQDMEDGDSLRISAKIIACVNAVDCRLTLCQDNTHSYRRRRRSSVLTDSLNQRGNKSSITRDLDVIVRMPGYVTASLARFRGNAADEKQNKAEGLLSCRTFAISLSVICLLFCLSITIAATFALRSRRKQL